MALGLMRKLLTGPWMQVVYSNVEIHHLEISVYFQTGPNHKGRLFWVSAQPR